MCGQSVEGFCSARLHDQKHVVCNGKVGAWVAGVVVLVNCFFISFDIQRIIIHRAVEVASDALVIVAGIFERRSFPLGPNMHVCHSQDQDCDAAKYLETAGVWRHEHYDDSNLEDLKMDGIKTKAL